MGLSVVMLTFPHIGYRQAVWRVDQKAGEVAVALSGMQPWCVLVALIFVIPTSLNVGGIWLGVATATLHLATVTLVYALWGPGLILESSPSTIATSMVVIVVFAGTLAMTNRRTAKKALARARLLSEQKEQLETSAAALRDATVEAETARAVSQWANQTKSEFLPLIGLTAHAMAGDEAQCREGGCDDFDTKPVDLKRLLGQIERWLPTPETS